MRKWRKDHLEWARAASRKGNQVHNDKRRSWLDSQKDKPCVDCGGAFPPVCMDFHHRDPSQKLFGVSTIIGKHRNLQEVADEIAKCDLICSNCHRIRTEKENHANLGNTRH